VNVYDVGGLTYQLSDEDAARLGAIPVKAAKAPTNKVVTPKNKGAGDADNRSGGTKRRRSSVTAK
jgi:hypothetical protein